MAARTVGGSDSCRRGRCTLTCSVVRIAAAPPELEAGGPHAPRPAPARRGTGPVALPASAGVLRAGACILGAARRTPGKCACVLPLGAVGVAGGGSRGAPLPWIRSGSPLGRAVSCRGRVSRSGRERVPVRKERPRSFAPPSCLSAVALCVTWKEWPIGRAAARLRSCPSGPMEGGPTDLGPAAPVRSRRPLAARRCTLVGKQTPRSRRIPRGIFGFSVPELARSASAGGVVPLPPAGSVVRAHLLIAKARCMCDWGGRDS